MSANLAVDTTARKGQHTATGQNLFTVMAGPSPGHPRTLDWSECVGARHKAGHDEVGMCLDFPSGCAHRPSTLSTAAITSSGGTVKSQSKFRVPRFTTGVPTSCS